jgi:UDP-3-O-[3-hydroxymyristoyl] glucosamine N-acyltransferase
LTLFARELLDFAATLGDAEARVPNSIDLDRLAIERVAVDDAAVRGDLAWISEGTARATPERLRDFRGSLLICPRDAAAFAEGDFISLSSKSPKALFAKIVGRFFAASWRVQWPSGSTAIASDARIGARVRLAYGVVIGPRVELGDDVDVGPNTCLANVRIGDRTRVGANCTIGLDGFGYARDALGAWVRFPHTGGVRIEADVEIGSNTCIDRGSIGDTVIRRGAKIDNLVHVAHNCDIGESSLLIAHAMIGGSTVIGADAWVAPSSSINNKLNIGAGVTIGTGAVVIRDVAPATTVVGNPAKPLDKRPSK